MFFNVYFRPLIHQLNNIAMLNNKLDQASKDCKAYRKYLKEKDIPQHLATKAYLITREMIDSLMAQNGGNIDGIRIYVGLDESTPEKAIKPYAVACVKNGEKYNDWNVPAAQQAVDASLAATTTSLDAAGTPTTATALTTDPTADTTTTDPVLVEEPRPCPSYCSDTNTLNSGV